MAAVAELVRIACDIASGSSRDDHATAISTAASWRRCNARGNGLEAYRRALSPGTSWRFVTSERLPRGTYRASDRNITLRGPVYPGDLVADFDRRLSGGASDGAAQHDGQIGLVISAGADGAEIVWMTSARQKDGTVRVILPTGAHLTVAGPEWR